MTYSFHPEASREAEKAVEYYREIDPELGENFRKEIVETIGRVLRAPNAWHPIKKTYRRCSLNRFPFCLIYRVDEQKDECQIFAVMHFKRKPGYWEKRKS
jgi:plasmid stabilization system protein ParE